MSNIDNAWLDIRWAIQDFAGHIPGRSNDDELVKDAYAGQISRYPFRMISLEYWVDALEERANEWYLERITNEVTLLSPVRYCKA